ncbi:MULTISPECIES: AAA family ATPase [Streptomyces]|uniref:AAA family ATPase n=1 Tax=Streptomyces TaxID=1883 RepID=UPI00099D2AA5|nr:AAA family ATPase [Streptomyces sp. NRRL F-2202]
MTLQRSAPVTGAPHEALPAQPGAPAREVLTERAPVVRDLRGRADAGPGTLHFAAGDLVVVSGLPGGGKSTLIRRTVTGHAVDSQDTRDRWTAALPPLLPYAVYRPLVRAAHYLGLRTLLRSGASVVVHDCGTQSWVRRWLARHAARRGRALHLVLLDVDPRTARQGQRERGRGVSGYAFARHRRAVARLLRDTERGRPPAGCATAVLLDREAADALHRISFGEATDHSGSTDHSGATGLPGLLGPTGPTGPTGPASLTGLTGPTGPASPTGSTGEGPPPARAG